MAIFPTFINLLKTFLECGKVGSFTCKWLASKIHFCQNKQNLSPAVKDCSIFTIIAVVSCPSAADISLFAMHSLNSQYP